MLMILNYAADTKQVCSDELSESHLLFLEHYYVMCFVVNISYLNDNIYIIMICATLKSTLCSARIYCPLLTSAVLTFGS